MPISVTIPVTCVVRISACEIFVMIAFCKPMVKQSRSTVTGSNSQRSISRWPPSRPKASSNIASSINGRAYSLCKRRRRAQLTRAAVVAAPATKAARDATPEANASIPPKATLSAIAETIPDMCDVY